MSRVKLLAAGFDTGALYRWRWPDPDPGLLLAPPPDGSGYQWLLDRGVLYPVVLEFNSLIEARIEVRVEVGAGCPSTMHVRATDGSTVLGEYFVGSEEMPDPGTSGVLTIWLDPWEQPAWNQAVARRVQEVVYDCSLDNGQTWRRFGVAAPSCWYVMVNANAYPEPDYKRYDLGVEKVVQYARGAHQPFVVLVRTTAGIDAEIYYDPNHAVAGHPLRVYDEGRALCKNNAELLEHLAESSGLAADDRYTWGGALADQADFYQPYWGSFQMLREAHDGAPQDPHFTYHAVTWGFGNYYDPSYGTWSAEAPSFNEVCEPYSVDEHGSVSCSPPEPEYVPSQQWGLSWPGPAPVLIPCGGAPPPP